jgi:hypothetical protein
LIATVSGMKLMVNNEIAASLPLLAMTALEYTDHG